MPILPKQYMIHEKNQLYRCRSGQRLVVWSTSAAPKYPSAANSIPPLHFPSSFPEKFPATPNIVLSAASLAQRFQTVRACQRSWEGEPARWLSPAALWHTHTERPRLLRAPVPPQHVFFSPPFNRKGNFTSNILAIRCCACWRQDKNGCRLLSTILLWKAAMTDICFSKYQISYMNQSFTVSVSVTPGDCLYSQAALKAQVLGCKIKSNSPAITTLKMFTLQFLLFFFFKKRKERTDRLFLY